MAGQATKLEQSEIAKKITICGGTMSFEDGYASIYSHIQEERLRLFTSVR